jgi:hypothetical protein
LRANEPSFQNVGKRGFGSPYRELVENLFEEPSDEKSFGPLGRDSPALQVIEVLLFERTDRRAMATDDIVTKNLEVGDRVGLGVLT